MNFSLSSAEVDPVKKLTKASFIYDVVQSAAAGYRGLGQNSSSVQMASANHVGAAVLVHVARSGRLDDVAL